MNGIRVVTRRGFLENVFSAGALILGAQVLPRTAHGAELQEPVDSAAWRPNLFIGLNTDGSVILVAHRSEMGTGIRTSLPMVLADEMEADWSRTRVEQALADSRYGSQDTDGSASIRDFYDTMREAGASARHMLESAAAQKWSVPASECRARLHEVVHEPTGRKVGFGDLTLLAAQQPVTLFLSGPAGVSIHRQRCANCRPRWHRNGQSPLRHGRDAARHGVCVD